MAYDESLARCVRLCVGSRADVTEKRMFGGLAFLLKGKMFCGIVKDELMVRVGPDRYEEMLDEPYVRPMDFTGRALTGFILVEPEGCYSEEEVRGWVKIGANFAATLENTKPKRKKTARKKAG